MRPHDGARAFAIDVEIADVEFAFGNFDLLARAGINRAGEAELSIIGDFEPVLEVPRLDDRQHRAENLLLLQLRLRLNVGDHSWLDEEPFAGFSCALAAGNEATFPFPNLDVVEDRFHRAFVDNRAHIGIGGGIANADALHAVLQPFEKLVRNAFINDCPRAG